MRGNIFSSRFLRLLCFLWCGLSASAQEFQIRAQVSTTTPQVGVPFTYQITISGAGGNMPRAQLGEMPDFDRYGSSSSQNISFVNGNVSASISQSFTLVPKREGRITIPPATIALGDRSIASNAIELTVGKASAAAPAPSSPQVAPVVPGAAPQAGASSTGVKVGIELIPSKKKVYLGEPVTLSVMVYGNTALAGFQLENSTPQGFWIENAKLPDQPEVEKSNRGGEQHYNVLVKRMILFPTTTGKIRIPAEKGIVQYYVRRAERSPFDDFFKGDPFFNDPFFRNPIFNSHASLRSVVTVEQTNAQSGSPEITVLPLSEAKKPADFNGAVGRFTLSARLDSPTAHVGEGIGLVVEIEGKGNLKGITFPGFREIPGVNLFTSNTTASFEADRNSYSAKKRFEYIAVPLAQGKYLIPPVSFSFFDPEAGTYRTIHSDTLILSVVPGAPTQAATAVASQILKSGQKEIIDIHEVRRMSLAPDQESSRFLLINLLPLVGILLLLLYGRHKKLLEADATYGGLHLSRGAARKYLKRAALMLSESDRLRRTDPGKAGPKRAPDSGAEQDAFYLELTQAMARFLGHRFGVAHAAIQPETLNEALGERLSAEHRIRCRELLTRCHLARFSPSAFDRAAQEADLRKCESLIKEIDQR